MAENKVKVTAKGLADIINSHRLFQRKEGKGKATYEVTVAQMTPIALALNGKAMPRKVFSGVIINGEKVGGTPNDRREWCIANGAPTLKVGDYCQKVNPQRPDNSFRARLHAWQELADTFHPLSYQRVKVTSTATEGHDEVFIFRVD